MGGRKGTSIDHACHYLLEQVYAAWNTKKVASMLLFDVAGAFDNINQSRLIHNLRKRQVDHKLVQWIQSFLSGRTTIIKTREHTTDPIFMPNGIPQGSALSQILYLFYNADLLDKIAKRKKTSAIGYIDDIAILTIEKTTEEICKTLAEVHTNICEPWSQSHASRFGLSKYQLVHLTRQTSAHTAESVQLPSGDIIHAQDYAKYLGLWLDRKLRWKKQVEEIKHKIEKSIKALASLGGSTWGISLHTIRKIYLAVVVPQMSYGCSVWYTPKGEKRHNHGHVRVLQSLQHKAQKRYLALSRPPQFQLSILKLSFFPFPKG